MAELSTFGIKMDTQAKEVVQAKISASGMTAAEYLQAAVTAYEVSKYKETAEDDKEIRLLDSHLSRISEVYVEMCKARRDEQSLYKIEKAALTDQLLILKADLMDRQLLLDKTLKSVERDRAEDQRALDKLKEEALEESTQLKRTLSIAYTERDGSREGLVKAEVELEAAQAHYRVLQQGYSALQDRLQKTEHLLDIAKQEATEYSATGDNLVLTISRLEGEISRVETDKDLTVKYLTVDHQTEILRVRESAFEQRKSYLQEIESLRKHNASLEVRLALLESAEYVVEADLDEGQ